VLGGASVVSVGYVGALGDSAGGACGFSASGGGAIGGGASSLPSLAGADSLICAGGGSGADAGVARRC